MAEPTAETGLQLDAGEADRLGHAFSPPCWLQELGRTSWLLVGFFVLVGGVGWLLGTTATIVGPVIAAAIIATVTAPIVSAMKRHHVPRAAGAAILLLALVALATVVALIVIGG